MAGGCIGPDCEPAPQEAEHVWWRSTGPIDLEPTANALSSQGWSVFDWSEDGSRFSANKSIESEEYRVTVGTIENSTRVELQSMTMVQYVTQSRDVLEPVMSELNSTVKQTIGPPTSASYNAGFPCADV